MILECSLPLTSTNNAKKNSQCVCVCVCVRKTKDRADGMRMCVCVREREGGGGGGGGGRETSKANGVVIVEKQNLAPTQVHTCFLKPRSFLTNL